MPPPQPNHRWYHVTPDRFFIGLLAAQVLLFLSEQFKWFPFNERKGWTVLIAVGVVSVAILVMLVWGLVCLCLRRRFQFGVRSLLLFLVVLSVPLGWFAWEMDKARRQREVRRALWDNRRGAFYDYEFGDDWFPEWNASPPSPAWLRKLLGDNFFCDVVMVTFIETDFSDNDARLVQELTNLKAMQFVETLITPEHIAHLARITKLKYLQFGQIPITDEDLSHLEGMTDLDILCLYDTEATDQGISQLQKALPHCHIRTDPWDVL